MRLGKIHCSNNDHKVEWGKNESYYGLEGIFFTSSMTQNLRVNVGHHRERTVKYLRIMIVKSFIMYYFSLTIY
jgi:hypothetical protein